MWSSWAAGPRSGEASESPENAPVLFVSMQLVRIGVQARVTFQHDVLLGGEVVANVPRATTKDT